MTTSIQFPLSFQYSEFTRDFRVSWRGKLIGEDSAVGVAQSGKPQIDVAFPVKYFR
jgi:hypothetical protein